MSYNRGKNYWKHLKRDFDKTVTYKSYEVDNKLYKELKGWGFDLKALRASEGALSSLDRRSPRADFTNVHPAEPKPSYQWDHYSGLPGPEAYMER